MAKFVNGSEVGNRLKEFRKKMKGYRELRRTQKMSDDDGMLERIEDTVAIWVKQWKKMKEMYVAEKGKQKDFPVLPKKRENFNQGWRSFKAIRFSGWSPKTEPPSPDGVLKPAPFSLSQLFKGLEMQGEGRVEVEPAVESHANSDPNSDPTSSTTTYDFSSLIAHPHKVADSIKEAHTYLKTVESKWNEINFALNKIESGYADLKKKPTIEAPKPRKESVLELVVNAFEDIDSGHAVLESADILDSTTANNQSLSVISRLWKFIASAIHLKQDDPVLENLRGVYRSQFGLGNNTGSVSDFEKCNADVGNTRTLSTHLDADISKIEGKLAALPKFHVQLLEKLLVAQVTEDSEKSFNQFESLDKVERVKFGEPGKNDSRQKDGVPNLAELQRRVEEQKGELENLKAQKFEIPAEKLGAFNEAVEACREAVNKKPKDQVEVQQIQKLCTAPLITAARTLLLAGYGQSGYILRGIQSYVEFKLNYDLKDATYEVFPADRVETLSRPKPLFTAHFQELFEEAKTVEVNSTSNQIKYIRHRPEDFSDRRIWENQLKRIYQEVNPMLRKRKPAEANSKYPDYRTIWRAGRREDKNINDHSDGYSEDYWIVYGSNGSIDKEGSQKLDVANGSSAMFEVNVGGSTQTALPHHHHGISAFDGFVSWVTESEAASKIIQESASNVVRANGSGNQEDSRDQDLGNKLTRWLHALKELGMSRSEVLDMSRHDEKSDVIKIHDGTPDGYRVGGSDNDNSDRSDDRNRMPPPHFDATVFASKESGFLLARLLKEYITTSSDYINAELIRRKSPNADSANAESADTAFDVIWENEGQSAGQFAGGLGQNGHVSEVEDVHVSEVEDRSQGTTHSENTTENTSRINGQKAPLSETPPSIPLPKWQWWATGPASAPRIRRIRRDKWFRKYSSDNHDDSAEEFSAGDIAAAIRLDDVEGRKKPVTTSNDLLKRNLAHPQISDILPPAGLHSSSEFSAADRLLWIEADLERLNRILGFLNAPLSFMGEHEADGFHYEIWFPVFLGDRFSSEVLPLAFREKISFYANLLALSLLTMWILPLIPALFSVTFFLVRLRRAEAGGEAVNHVSGSGGAASRKKLNDRRNQSRSSNMNDYSDRGQNHRSDSENDSADSDAFQASHRGSNADHCRSSRRSTGNPRNAREETVQLPSDYSGRPDSQLRRNHSRRHSRSRDCVLDRNSRGEDSMRNRSNRNCSNRNSHCHNSDTRRRRRESNSPRNSPDTHHDNRSGIDQNDIVQESKNNSGPAKRVSSPDRRPRLLDEETDESTNGSGSFGLFGGGGGSHGASDGTSNPPTRQRKSSLRSAKSSIRSSTSRNSSRSRYSERAGSVHFDEDSSSGRSRNPTTNPSKRTGRRNSSKPKKMTHAVADPNHTAPRVDAVREGRKPRKGERKAAKARSASEPDNIIMNLNHESHDDESAYSYPRAEYRIYHADVQDLFLSEQALQLLLSERDGADVSPLVPSGIVEEESDSGSDEDTVPVHRNNDLDESTLGEDELLGGGLLEHDGLLEEDGVTGGNDDIDERRNDDSGDCNTSATTTAGAIAIRIPTTTDDRAKLRDATNRRIRQEDFKNKTKRGNNASYSAGTETTQIDGSNKSKPSSLVSSCIWCLRRRSYRPTDVNWFTFTFCSDPKTAVLTAQLLSFALMICFAYVGHQTSGDRRTRLLFLGNEVLRESWGLKVSLMLLALWSFLVCVAPLIGSWERGVHRVAQYMHGCSLVVGVGKSNSVTESVGFWPRFVACIFDACDFIVTKIFRCRPLMTESTEVKPSRRLSLICRTVFVSLLVVIAFIPLLTRSQADVFSSSRKNFNQQRPEQRWTAVGIRKTVVMCTAMLVLLLQMILPIILHYVCRANWGDAFRLGFTEEIMEEGDSDRDDHSNSQNSRSVTSRGIPAREALRIIDQPDANLKNNPLSTRMDIVAVSKTIARQNWGTTAFERLHVGRSGRTTHLEIGKLRKCLHVLILLVGAAVMMMFGYVLIYQGEHLLEEAEPLAADQ